MDPSRDAPPPAPPHRVRLPVNEHRWEDISFLHWPVPAAEVAALLPDGLRPDTFSGSAWVGVTPFSMRVRVPGLHLEPPGAVFPETNVRTYVTGPGGRRGLWFLHMEVTARWFVATLRPLGLPYVRRDMTVTGGGGRFSYVSRSPDGPGGHDIAVTVDDAIAPPGGGPFERFLTARWAAYHRVGPVLLRTPVDHAPWPLHRASAERWDVAGLFRAAGLGGPDAPPVAHYSSGVTVSVGRPRRVG